MLRTVHEELAHTDMFTVRESVAAAGPHRPLGATSWEIHAKAIRT